MIIVLPNFARRYRLCNQMTISHVENRIVRKSIKRLCWELFNAISQMFKPRYRPIGCGKRIVTNLIKNYLRFDDIIPVFLLFIFPDGNSVFEQRAMLLIIIYPQYISMFNRTGVLHTDLYRGQWFCKEYSTGKYLSGHLSLFWRRL